MAATKSLVIVESPAKARTINKYLGRQYVVKSSVGHVRDLPTSGGGRKKTTTKKKTASKKSPHAALISRLAVDPDNNWRAYYEILPGKEKVLKELKALAKTADAIYLATDLDREGEAIAWHLREAIGGDEDRYRRVTFSEITRKAVQDAFADPQDINMDRVNAQQARRFLDRVVGYMVSPLLWKKIARGLSAGRVQSVAVKLIAQREKEINAFKIEEFWEVFCQLKNSATLRAQVIKEHGKQFRPPDKDSCAEKSARLRQCRFVVSACEKKAAQSKPPAPLITSTLQQAASTRLGFGVRKTMMFAQRLYEAGHITYMRTDSTNVSKDAIAACRAFISNNFSKPYLPQSANVYASGKAAQEAHEAIRPTDVGLVPQNFVFKDAEAVRLYDLIWRYFVASQMARTEFDTTTVTIKAEEFELKVRGRILKFDGYQKVLPPVSKESDVVLPELREGEELQLVDIEENQRFTRPPPRYSEAALVKELEKSGIGRPSTYASIISTIQERGYVKVEKKRFYLLKMGDIVTSRLEENFHKLMDFGFTASMEEELDAIAGGRAQWMQVLNDFYGDFKATLQAAEKNMRPNNPTEIELKCKCERRRNMMIRNASTGVFLSCSGYQLPPKERCKETINLVAGEETVSDDDGEVKELQARHRCPQCGTAMTAYLIDAQRCLHICANNPDCPAYEIEHGSFKIKGYDGPVITCDKCGADMQLKTGRFGKYFSCTAYPECKNTRKLLRNGEAAPPRADPVPMPELKCEKSDGHFVLRDGASGVFLASSNYPRSRETRAPLVEDLQRHADELDPKFQFLLEAPAVDNEGNKVAIKFSRKTRSYYLVGMQGDKPSKWSASWVDGKWQERK